VLFGEAEARRWAPASVVRQFRQDHHRRLTACASAFALAPLGFGIGRLQRRVAPLRSASWWTAIVLVTVILEARGFSPPIERVDPAYGDRSTFALIAAAGLSISRYLGREEERPV
jgi:hypothetical protein